MSKRFARVKFAGESSTFRENRFVQFYSLKRIERKKIHSRHNAAHETSYDQIRRNPRVRNRPLPPPGERST
jgi:hypothetical protein